MATSVNCQGVVTAPQGVSSAKDPRQRFKKSLRGLGIAECAIGGLSVFLQIIAASIAKRELFNYVTRLSYYWSYYYTGQQILTYFFNQSYKLNFPKGFLALISNLRALFL